MKSVLDIQRNWDIEWFTPLAESLALTDEVKYGVKGALRLEVYWIATAPMNSNIEDSITKRMNKITTLAALNSGSASSFDPYFDYRKQFFAWTLA